MTDLAQQNLKQPEQTDWNTAYSNASKYQAPPPSIGADGKPIVYYGTIKEFAPADPDQGYLNFTADFILTRSGPFDGTRIRTWASTRPFQKRNKDTGELEAVKGNPNSLGKLLKAAGLQVTPQTNDEYVLATRQINGKVFGFTTDWKAKNKDTGEVIVGYNSFPDDPERPGMKKSILRAGDVYNETDSKGNVIGQKVVQSEILFANPQLKYFQDATPKVSR